MRTQYYILKRMLCICLLIFISGSCDATNRISVASGNWNSGNAWLPSGTPLSSDNITIASGHTITVNANQTIHQITIDAGGTLKWANASTLSITGNLTVNGTANMNGGNISLSNSGSAFTLGPNSSFTWEPGMNTAAGASLFTNSIESFNPSSSLIIKKWYDYTVPIGSVVTGSFGNIELNSLNGNVINEWNQNNQFESHQILGTLSIDQGWITLDKSRSISNTTIGNIVLKNVNSSFYGHNSTHGGSFTITTSSVTNNGGNFFGLNDGNGNVTLHVIGNFTNLGNVKIINNSGVSGVSNGNAALVVDQTFSQSSGDTRIIYNVSTANSGLFTAGFRNLKLTGGIFMGQTGCRTSGGICSIAIEENLTINFQNTTDKFRGTSLSSIGSYINNVQLNISIGGNLSVSGNLTSEVTSASSAGQEEVQINGNVSIQGCNVSFNYGSANASHNHSLIMNGNVDINGGTTFFSRNNGISSISIAGDFTLSAGWCSIKGGDSLTTLTINGNFAQKGGTFYVHNNNTLPSTTPISMIVSQDFSQSAGIFNFESVTSNSSSSHSLTVKGTSFTISGTGIITHSGAGTSLSFGIINFNRTGTMSYSHLGNAHLISQVKQVVKTGCTVNIVNGNMQAASHSTTIYDFIKVETGGTLNVQNNQVFSSVAFPNSGIQVDSAATIITQRTQGFYDGTSNACINADNAINYFLHPNSIVEYNGTADQTVTSTGKGIATSIQHEYGILRINLVNASNKASLTNTVLVRTELQLTNGELNLNGDTISILNGLSSAITRTKGYINSELTSQSQFGIVTWKNTNPGSYEFPFGTDTSSYIPTTLATGTGNDISVSTYATSGRDNLPFPLARNGVVNFSSYGVPFVSNNVIDRWWVINSTTAATANIKFSYRAIENTLAPAIQTCTMNALQWNGTKWNSPSTASLGVRSGIGKVSVPNTLFSTIWTLGRLQAGTSCHTGFINFDVELVGSAVALRWRSNSETNDETYSVERSGDGTHFEEITNEKASGNSTTSLNYSKVDEHPLPGISYYRLKQTDPDGSFIYSDVRTISFNDIKTDILIIESFGPNPFKDNFGVSYNINKEGTVSFQFSNGKGQLISSSQSSETAGSHRFEFNNGSKLRPGIYFLKIIFNGKTVIQRLVKE